MGTKSPLALRFNASHPSSVFRNTYPASLKPILVKFAACSYGVTHIRISYKKRMGTFCTTPKTGEADQRDRMGAFLLCTPLKAGEGRGSWFAGSYRAFRWCTTYMYTKDKGSRQLLGSYRVLLWCAAAHQRQRQQAADRIAWARTAVYCTFQGQRKQAATYSDRIDPCRGLPQYTQDREIESRQLIESYGAKGLLYTTTPKAGNAGPKGAGRGEEDLLRRAHAKVVPRVEAHGGRAHRELR